MFQLISLLLWKGRIIPATKPDVIPGDYFMALNFMDDRIIIKYYEHLDFQSEYLDGSEKNLFTDQSDS